MMNKGQDKLWLWFGLSRASFLIMPRSFMHAMPDEWQSKIADLLEQWDATWNWDNCEIEQLCASAKKDGKYVRIPDYILNYRHPNRNTIEGFKND